MGLINSNTLNNNLMGIWSGIKRIPKDLKGLLGDDVQAATQQAMINPQPANPEQWMDAGMELSGMAPVGGLLAHTVYHGSPHKFSKFDMSKIGTGEGAQAYGHGIYAAESPDVAKSYMLAGTSGNMPATIDKAGANVLPSYAKQGGQLSVSDPGVVQDLGLLDVKSRGDMLSMMRGLAQDSKVADSVVRLIPIDVVNALGGKKVTAKMLRHNPSMLIDLLPANADDLVPGSIPAVNEIASRMASVTAKDPLLSGSDSGQQFLKRFAAGGADEGFTHVGNIQQKPFNGNLYKVDIPDESIPRMLDWDAPLSKQPEGVRVAVQDLGLPANATGKDAYNALANLARDGAIARGNNAATTLGGSQSAASVDLQGYGIPGIRYLDGMSRGKGGTSNFVLFDDQLPRILEVNGQPTGLKPWAEDARGLLDGPAMSKADEAGGLLGKVDNAPMGKQFNWDNPGGGIRTVKVGDTTIDYGFDGKSAHIASLRTPAAKRNKGSARAAMEQFLREADELGIPIKLESSPLDKKTKDLRLFNFYKSLGFEPTGKKINAVGDPEMIRKPKGPRILEINGQPTGLLSYADEAAQATKKVKRK